MLVYPTTQRWISGLAFLCLPLMVVIGCGVAPEVSPGTDTVPTTTDDSAQRSVITDDAGQRSSTPVLQPGEIPPGDMDGNGEVDVEDLNAFVAQFDTVFGAGVGNSGYDKSLDMNGDGLVTWSDLQLFLELVD